MQDPEQWEGGQSRTQKKASIGDAPLLHQGTKQKQALFYKGMYLCVCVCMCMYACSAHVYATCIWVPKEARRPLKLELQAVISCPKWVLGTKLRSHRKAAKYSLATNPSLKPQEQVLERGC